jgi:hypothetical protein
MAGVTAQQARQPNAYDVGRLRATSRRSAWLFSIALFGYPIVGNLTSIFQIDSREGSIPFRIIVVMFSVWIIVTTKPLRLDLWRLLMVLIWFLYILRLIHDWLVSNLDGADYALQFFVVTSVIPAIALIKARTFQGRRFAFTSFVIASLGAGTSLLVMLFGNAELQEVTVSLGRLSVAALDPTSLAYEATSAVLCGSVLWRGASMIQKMCMAGIFIAMMWCLVLTGAKGPALALLLGGALWGFRNGQTWKFAILALPVLVAAFALEGNPLVARLSASGDDESTVTRIVILSDSINQIAVAPLIGSAFVEYNSGYYPHNIFVETAMALGIPVALLFLALMLFGSWSAWKTLKGEYTLLGLLFFQGLFAASTTGSIFGAISLWIPFAMLPRLTSALGRSRLRSGIAISAAEAKSAQ